MSYFMILVNILLFTLVSSTFLPPSTPDSFSASIKTTFFGFQVPGMLYFDYINAVAYRIDTIYNSQSTTDLYLYALPNPLHYQYSDNSEFKDLVDVEGNDCPTENIEGQLFPMSIPSIANFQGNQTINGVLTEHWNLLWFGVELDWWVLLTDPLKRDGVLSRFSTSGVTALQIDFTKVVPGPQDPSIFAVPTFCEPPVPVEQYTVQGFLQSAVNLSPLPNVQVLLDSTTSTTTDINGVFTFYNVTPGLYSISAQPTGYYSASRSVNVSGDILAGSSADLQCSPVLPSGSFRAVLTWGANPPGFRKLANDYVDLDSHMLNPGNCETYYRNKVCNLGQGASVVLDVDAVRGFGPETISANQITRVGGIYKYFVYVYTQGGSFVGSNAAVSLYGTQGLIASYDVPQTGYNPSFRTWNVFYINGTSGAITTVNQISP